MSSSAIVSSTTFSANSAGTCGGGLFLYTAGDLAITNSTIFNNSAVNGSGVCAQSATSVQILDCVLDSNVGLSMCIQNLHIITYIVTAAGGGIYTISTYVGVTHSTISFNM